jgi:hypothetical protein
MTLALRLKIAHRFVIANYFRRPSLTDQSSSGTACPPLDGAAPPNLPAPCVYPRSRLTGTVAALTTEPCASSRLGFPLAKPTFPEMRGNGKDAPFPAIRAAALFVSDHLPATYVCGCPRHGAEARGSPRDTPRCWNSSDLYGPCAPPRRLRYGAVRGIASGGRQSRRAGRWHAGGRHLLRPRSGG